MHCPRIGLAYRSACAAPNRTALLLKVVLDFYKTPHAAREKDSAPADASGIASRRGPIRRLPQRSRCKSYTHCHRSLRECRRRLAAFEWQPRRLGYAPWAAIASPDSRLVGWGGVYVDPFDPQWGPELGYSFHPDVWGRGFATELASACWVWGRPGARPAGRVGLRASG